MSLLLLKPFPNPQNRNQNLNHRHNNSTMKTPLKRLALLVLASAAWTLVGTSCRTVHGFGQDVEHVGGHIEHAANR
jgi:predicted small secreted protein